MAGRRKAFPIYYLQVSLESQTLEKSRRVWEAGEEQEDSLNPQVLCPQLPQSLKVGWRKSTLN